MKLSQAQLLAQLEKRVTVDETEIKRKIMDNYGFVDMENDSKYHRPIISKKNVSLVCLLLDNIKNFASLRMTRNSSVTVRVR